MSSTRHTRWRSSRRRDMKRARLPQGPPQTNRFLEEKLQHKTNLQQCQKRLQAGHPLGTRSRPTCTKPGVPRGGMGLPKQTQERSQVDYEQSPIFPEGQYRASETRARVKITHARKGDTSGVMGDYSQSTRRKCQEPPRSSAAGKANCVLNQLCISLWTSCAFVLTITEAPSNTRPEKGWSTKVKRTVPFCRNCTDRSLVRSSDSTRRGSTSVAPTYNTINGRKKERQQALYAGNRVGHTK